MKTSASEQIQIKWTDLSNKKYSLRSIANNDLKVPEKPNQKCLGFTYSAAKMFNMLPIHLRETRNPKTFKNMTKHWIWENIPSH